MATMTMLMLTITSRVTRTNSALPMLKRLPPEASANTLDAFAGIIICIICTIICIIICIHRWHNLDEELQHGGSLQMFCLSWFCVFSGLPALYDSPVICTKYLYFDTNLKSMFKTFKCWVSKIHICIQIQKNKQTFPRLDLHYAVPVSPLPSSAPPSHLPRSPGQICVFFQQKSHISHNFQTDRASRNFVNWLKIIFQEAGRSILQPFLAILSSS